MTVTNVLKKFDKLAQDQQKATLAACKTKLGLRNNGELSALLNIERRTLDNWSSERRAMPGAAKRLLALVLWLHAEQQETYKELAQLSQLTHVV